MAPTVRFPDVVSLGNGRYLLVTEHARARLRWNSNITSSPRVVKLDWGNVVEDMKGDGLAVISRNGGMTW